MPILMYHHVGQLQPEWDRLRRSLTVSEESFRWQLEYLHRNGYRSITLSDLVAYLANGRPLPMGKTVIITFDDGYRDNYEAAFPILKEYGFTATFFLVTGPIDEGSPEFLTWQQVIEMHTAGMEFGAHSYTHPDLRDQPVDYVIWQVVGSKEAIEARIEEPVRFFAYPSGAYDDQVIAVLKSAGFWGAVTTSFGCKHTSDDVWTLLRVRVSPQDSERSFADKLGACPH
ncbi:MAG: polysaccharide deacetylase family protein [Anaerolineae bacterium]